MNVNFIVNVYIIHTAKGVVYWVKYWYIYIYTVCGAVLGTALTLCRVMCLLLVNSYNQPAPHFIAAGPLTSGQPVSEWGHIL